MVISYVVGRASSSAGSQVGNIEERLLQSSPILEAFGNAKSKSFYSDIFVSRLNVLTACSSHVLVTSFPQFQQFSIW